jgi:hypothetical protein
MIVICAIAGALLIVLIWPTHGGSVAVQFVGQTSAPAGVEVQFVVSNCCPHRLGIYVPYADGVTGVLEARKSLRFGVLAPRNGLPWRLPVQYASYRTFSSRQKVDALLHRVLRLRSSRSLLLWTTYGPLVTPPSPARSVAEANLSTPGNGATTFFFPSAAPGRATE